MNIEGIAELGYIAYSKSTNNKNFRGDEMPKWKDLPEAIQKAWMAATDEIIETARKAVYA